MYKSNKWLALDFIAAHAYLEKNFIMKPSIILSALLILVLLGCKDKEKVIEIVEEVPEDVFHIDLCETLNSSVMKLMTESHNNKEKYPELFTGSQEQIVLTKQSNVYISYVTEGAAIPSTLGWYTYTGTSPGSSEDIEKKIMFPNVSSSVLNPGDSRMLGNFPAGTVIGFYLIVGGYNNSTVNYSKPTFYTNFSWNPGQFRQHVLFREQQCNNILMGFEDKAIEGGADNDYNDIIFLISDNDSNQASTAFDQGSMVSM
jgi:hypothetical protein